MMKPMSNPLRLLALLATLVLAGCNTADRAHATVSIQGGGVDELALAQAIDLWRAGTDGAVDLTLVDGDSNASVIVQMGKLAPRECAETDVDSGVVTVNTIASDTCKAQPVAVLAHELGHFVANRTDHAASPRAVMFSVAHYATTITTEDRNYIEGK